MSNIDREFKAYLDSLEYNITQPIIDKHIWWLAILAFIALC